MAAEHKRRGLGWLLIRSRPGVPFSCWAAVPVDAQHSCVIAEFATAGFDHGLCQRLYRFAWMKVPRLREDLHRVHIGRVALQHSVGQEYDAVTGLQDQFLNGVSGIDRYTERQARG